MSRRFVAGALALVSVAAYAVVASPAGAAVNGAAGGGAVARRGPSFELGATCDLTTTTALAARHPTVNQFVIVATDSFATPTASVEVVARGTDGIWRCQRPAMAAMVGRNGTRPLAERRSGDDTTPAGVFPLGTVTAWDGQVFQFFGNRPDPGVRGSYRAVRNEDCWGATPNTARYQHLVNRPGCSGPDEWLAKFGDVYEHAAVIGANLDPISGDEPGEPALAAAIFLHRHSYSTAGTAKATAGCVSLADADLVATLRLLDPGLGVHFAIGPLAFLRSTA